MSSTYNNENRKSSFVLKPSDFFDYGRPRLSTESGDSFSETRNPELKLEPVQLDSESSLVGGSIMQDSTARALVRTDSGREGRLMFEAQDEGESVGCVQFSEKKGRNSLEMRPQDSYKRFTEEPEVEKQEESPIKSAFSYDTDGYLEFNAFEFLQSLDSSNMKDGELQVKNSEGGISFLPEEGITIFSDSLMSIDLDEESISLKRDAFKKVRFSPSTIHIENEKQKRLERQIQHALESFFS